MAVVWSEPYRVYADYDATDVTALERERIDWNPDDGFAIPEAAQHVGWLTLLRADRIEYAQVVRGQQSGDVYLITAESLREYQAGYGGAVAWDGAIAALKARVTA